MKILICYDGSPVAKNALSAGIKIGNALDAEIHIFYSIVPKKETKEVFEFIKDGLQKEMEDAEKEIAEVSQIVEKTGLICKTHIVIEEKNPGEDITDFAEKIEAEYIVIGVRTQSRVGKLIFGSTAQYVILHSLCPVITVRS